MLKTLGYVGDSEPNEEGLQAGLATVASCGFVATPAYSNSLDSGLK